MVYSDDAPRERSFQPRQMQDVSAMGLKCANCQQAITELPFTPSADRPVYCRECHRSRREPPRQERRW